jgi:hypothetical protein
MTAISDPLIPHATLVDLGAQVNLDSVPSQSERGSAAGMQSAEGKGAPPEVEARQASVPFAAPVPKLI